MITKVIRHNENSIKVGTTIATSAECNHMLDRLYELSKRNKRIGSYYKVQRTDGKFEIWHELKGEEIEKAVNRCLWYGHQYDTEGTCLVCHHEK